MWFQRLVEAIHVDTDKTIDNPPPTRVTSHKARETAENAEKLKDFQRVRLHVLDIKRVMRNPDVETKHRKFLPEVILDADLEDPYDSGEPTYCICNGVSYGVMIACDGDNVSLSLPSIR